MDTEAFIAKCIDVLESTSKGAAFKSGLPHNKMTAGERICFPDIANSSDDEKRAFLSIRNYLLKSWLDQPAKELTWSTAVRHLKTPVEPGLVRRVHAYLQRHGFINFGSILYEREPTAVNRKKVIVIGGGIAGNAAANQLHLLGMDVTILEARDYYGGRICTIQRQDDYFDVGAQTLDGTIGNPITVLMEQMGLQHELMPTDHTLYDVDGEPIPDELRDRVKAKVAQVLNMANLLSILAAPRCESHSLGHAIDFIIEEHQLICKRKQLQYDEELVAAIGIHDTKKHVLEAHFQNALILKETLDPNYTAQLELYRGLQAQVMVVATEYQACKKTVGEKMRNRPTTFYLTQAERRIMDWCIAHYEFTCGASVNQMAMNHFPLRKSPVFLGPVTTIKRGHTSVILGMGSVATHKKHMVVDSVDYSSRPVKVSGHNSWTRKPFCMSADVVLSTLPLGVLKKEQVLFQPPLPHWKTDAIRRMGLGAQVKIWLRFKTIFWKPDERSFGKVNISCRERGDAYHFYSLEKRPTLVAHASGNAATLMEDLADSPIILRCMEVLESLFGENIPSPCEASVTRWGTNPHSQGACSYVAVGGDPEDYNALAFPVAPTSNAREPPVPNLFFAGEHTSYKYPATTHGAFLSGLREAGRIADCYFGRLEGTPDGVTYSLRDAFNAAPRDKLLDIDVNGLKKLAEST